MKCEGSKMIKYLWELMNWVIEWGRKKEESVAFLWVGTWKKSSLDLSLVRGNRIKRFWCRARERVENAERNWNMAAMGGLLRSWFGPLHKWPKRKLVTVLFVPLHWHWSLFWCSLISNNNAQFKCLPILFCKLAFFILFFFLIYVVDWRIKPLTLRLTIQTLYQLSYSHFYLFCKLLFVNLNFVLHFLIYWV